MMGCLKYNRSRGADPRRLAGCGGGAQLGREALCFLSHVRPQGSNAQTSRASLCAAHGRPTFPENPHSAKVQMDTEGLGANSSLGASPSWAQSPGPRALPSPSDPGRAWAKPSCDESAQLRLPLSVTRFPLLGLLPSRTRGLCGVQAGLPAYDGDKDEGRSRPFFKVACVSFPFTPYSLPPPSRI